MKSLRFMRLSSLQEENFIKIVYGKNRKFSGYVTDNDHKKSLELLNKKLGIYYHHLHRKKHLESFLDFKCKITAFSTNMQIFM